MRNERSPARWLQVAAVAAMAVAALATSPAWTVPVPAWQIDGSREQGSDHLTLRAWISKSDREGMGVTLRVRNTGPAAVPFCITEAAFLSGDLAVTSGAAPSTALIGPGTTRHFYLPFLFENHATKKIRHGRLEIGVSAGRAPARIWRLPVSHRKRDLDVRSGLAAPPVKATGPMRDGGLPPDAGLVQGDR